MHAYRIFHMVINCCGRILDLNKPLVMGILNLTDDSFYDGGKYTTTDKAVQHCERMMQEGATIIDVGASSSRPGSTFQSPEVEMARLVPVVSSIVARFPDAVVSIDTCYASVVKACHGVGAHIINDITGGSVDAATMKMAAQLRMPYILMHMQGTPATMQHNPVYNDVVVDVAKYFVERISMLRSVGVCDIIIDPGFGFGKTTDHNFELLARLSDFGFLNLPVLAGLSRKSMISKSLSVKTADTLTGTTVLNTIALMNGASILRVHDVKDASETIKLFNMVKQKSLIAQ